MLVIAAEALEESLEIRLGAGMVVTLLVDRRRAVVVVFLAAEKAGTLVILRTAKEARTLLVLRELCLVDVST